MEHEGARRDRLDGVPDEAVGRLRAVGRMVIADDKNARRIGGGKRCAIANADSMAHMPAFAANNVLAYRCMSICRYYNTNHCHVQ